MKKLKKNWDAHIMREIKKWTREIKTNRVTAKRSQI